MEESKRPKTTNPSFPDATIEMLARGFFREAASYGFRRMDYVRFVNTLLDAAMSANEPSEGNHHPGTMSTKADEIPDTETSRIDASTTAHMPLVSKDVKIRAFDRKKDMPYLREWIADELGRYFMLSTTTAEHEKLENLIGNESTVLGVITYPDGTPVGVIAYLNHDAWHKKAELRKLVGHPLARGKGLGLAATRLWIQYGKEGLALKKVYLNTLDTNIRNIRLNKELGFKIEGILRNELLIDGTYRDVLRMGLWLD